MTKWKSLAGKFSEEELEDIKKFQKVLGVNDNQFIRYSVIMMVFFFGGLLKLVELEDVKTLDKKYRNFKKKISKYPQLKEVRPFVKEMQKSWEQAITKVINENQPKLKKFTKKRKVGRPKSRKKKRGRPADKGI